jgi:hypothetical protein
LDTKQDKSAKATDPLPQLRAKVIENQMWILLRHRPSIRDIVPKNNVVQGKVCRRTVREMANDHAVRLSTVLMENYQVGHFIRPASLHKLFNDVGTAVDSLRVWETETHFL